MEGADKSDNLCVVDLKSGDSKISQEKPREKTLEFIVLKNIFIN